jgi:Protein of unknown function (DUF3365)
MTLRIALAAALAASAGGARFDPRAPPAPLREAVERAERAIRAAACDAERRFGEGDPDANAADCDSAGGVGGEAPYLNDGEADDPGTRAADPTVAARVARASRSAEGAVVGRTSARLRNPENAPPAWAKDYVASTDGRKAANVAPAAFDLGDRVGVLRPIEIRKRCLGCHDAREKVPASTRAWLARSYPADRAFGYAVGDLRGFWWAEAPKEPAASAR